MIPPAADTQAEDPTTQMPWPSSRDRDNDSDTLTPGNDDDNEILDHEELQQSVGPVKKKKKLSTWNLITLSISMAGAQIAWTVELGYGTPFLLSLGISEQMTSLVWLAGPISGLIAQPVIGAISDASTSKYRRRYWIISSTAALVFATIVLAYCESLAAFFVDLFGVGAGDWDKKRSDRVASTAIGFAVVMFYILDFALNALQASLRNLLLDIAPAAQLNAGNAWHSRMTNAGNIIGYGFGFFPLASLPFLRIFGGSQFRKFCIICIVILVITVGITCYYHEEEERPKLPKKQSGNAREILQNIYTSIVHLPKSIRRVCYVQLFAFMGWFPFLFYATTYVGQVMAHEIDAEPNAEYATRIGELAMLIHSVVAVVAGVVLPHLANRDRRLLAHKEDVTEDAEISRLRATVRRWRAEAARKGAKLRLPVMPFLLRNIWSGAMLWFSILTFSTFWVNTVPQAIAFISLVGVSWAVAMWAPFAIIMELLKELHTPDAAEERPAHTRTISAPGHYGRMNGERTPLVRSRSHDDTELGDVPPQPSAPAGGTILGIHNLAIVMPQFVVSVATNLIFRAVDGSKDNDPSDENSYYGKNGVAWVLRFGGLCTLFGALLARRVAPTPTEKAMRRRLSEMHALREERP